MDNRHFITDDIFIAKKPSEIFVLESKFDKFELVKRAVSGTYKNQSFAGTVIELRVDVDGKRPMNRVSGDIFVTTIFKTGSYIAVLKKYKNSLIVENLTNTTTTNQVTLTGPVKYYDNPTNTSDTIEVTIPRVPFYLSPADAVVKFYTSGVLKSTYVCKKISEYFRQVTLEIDMLQGTAFLPTVNTLVDPHPSDLEDMDMTTNVPYKRAGIDMTVNEDDVLNDSDSSDSGTTWSYAELHDLMETRFDLFANKLQWNVYGVVVPWFDSSTLYGIMFDWAGGQPGDTFFRQGSAIARNAILGRVSGTLYNTTVKRDRLTLWTFIHEIGHAFNLPHSWLRSNDPDSASESFMNYPWGYTGGTGTETAYWENFRWAFDDSELLWMRHGDRNSVIFGGTNWVWNNLSSYTDPQLELEVAPLSLEVRGKEIYGFAQPVQVELKLKNISKMQQTVLSLLEPEDDWVTIYMTQPDGQRVPYCPPMIRTRDPETVTLAPGEAIYESVVLSFSAKGLMFKTPGEYKIRAYYNMANKGLVVSPNFRTRIATPKSQSTEELAHLLFSNEASKYLYFGGSERYPEITARLKEATETYKKTDPNVIPFINIALGKHQSRPFKQVNIKDGKRIITRKPANLEEAVMHLEAARKLPTSGISAIDNITYNRTSMLLTDLYKQKKQNKDAGRVLQETLQYLKKRKVTQSVINKYEKRIKELEKTA